MSARRRSELDARSDVRAAVIVAANERCQAWGIPDVPHNHQRPRLNVDQRQVHELQGGQLRAVSYLDPSGCLLLCGSANHWISNEEPAAAERRGLRLPSWCGPEHVAEAAVLRAGWQQGERPVPSWWPQGERI